jgi:TolB-like protein/DNA-binding winged helix-turn-helix (wHTH) protein
MSSSPREPAIKDRAAEAPLAHRLHLSGFVLDLAAGELLTADHQLAGLRKQALDVLLLLGARAGQVVTKEELMRSVWQDVVVGDGSLAQAISDIRRVLGDAGHRLVRSIARRGYMLVPDLSPAGLDQAMDLQTRVTARGPTDTAAVNPAATPGKASLLSRRRVTFITALCISIALIGGTVALLMSEAQRIPAATTRAALAPEVPSVSMVVLPLKGESGAADDWFADAITADLTASMGRMSGSFVIGRDTAFSYKGKAADPRDVARELGVRYVVVGSTRRDGNRIRLDLTMIDGESGNQQWGQQFDIERADLERSIDDIVGQLARSVFVQLFHSVGDRTTRLKPAEVAADDLAMRGWSVHMRGLSPENLREALRLFEAAVAKDPGSARALAGVSTASSWGVIVGWVPDKAAALQRAEEANSRLEQLGADDWFALIARIGPMNVRGEWENMLRLTDTMVERFPNDPSGYHLRSTALMYLGRFEESIAPAQRAIRISPRDTRLGLWHLHVANNQFMLGQYEAATENARRMLAANAKLPLATPLLAASLVRSGRKLEGETLFRNYLAANPDVDVARVVGLMRSSHPAFVEGRDRMIASLREIGLR